MDSVKNIVKNALTTFRQKLLSDTPVENDSAHALSLAGAYVMQTMMLSAFEIVVENNEYVLYWHGPSVDCPYELQLINGEYVLCFTYTSSL